MGGGAMAPPCPSKHPPLISRDVNNVGKVRVVISTYPTC